MSINSSTLISLLSEFKEYAEVKADILSEYADLLNSPERIYLFGCSKQQGSDIKKGFENLGYKIEGFIDNDPNKQGKDFLGVKVYSLDEVKQINKNPLIVITTAGWLNVVKQQLKMNGFSKIIPYQILYLFNPDVFKSGIAFSNLLGEVMANFDEYAKTYRMLADNKSRIIYINLLLFRLTYNDDYTFISCGSKENVVRYFNDKIISLSENEVFVDGGGFDGDTTLEFITAAKKSYKKVYLFEPDKSNLHKAKSNLKAYDNIEFFDRGLFTEHKVIKFQSNSDITSNVCEDGNLEIECVSLDELIEEKVSLIKLDIEGSEADAILGARKHIQNDTPKLIISGYHRPGDLWKLPKLIFEMNNRYDLFIRHYSQTVYESVFYFIPKPQN